MDSEGPELLAESLRAWGLTTTQVTNAINQLAQSVKPPLFALPLDPDDLPVSQEEIERWRRQAQRTSAFLGSQTVFMAIEIFNVVLQATLFVGTRAPYHAVLALAFMLLTFALWRWAWRFAYTRYREAKDQILRAETAAELRSL